MSQQIGSLNRTLSFSSHLQRQIFFILIADLTSTPLPSFFLTHHTWTQMIELEQLSKPSPTNFSRHLCSL